jgi:hypothetical protein
LPDRATHAPKASPPAASEAVNAVGTLQVPLFVNTYAAPGPPYAPVPTSAVLPSLDSATERPRLMLPDTVSFDCWFVESVIT